MILDESARVPNQKKPVEAASVADEVESNVHSVMAAWCLRADKISPLDALFVIWVRSTCWSFKLRASGVRS